MRRFRDLQKSALFFQLRPVLCHFRYAVTYQAGDGAADTIHDGMSGMEFIRTMNRGILVLSAKSIDWINTSEGKGENTNRGIENSLTLVPT